MSLNDVKILRGVKFDINDGGGAVSRSYIAATVRAEVVKKGQQWRTANGRQHRNIRHQWIRFTVEGELIDQVDNLGSLRDPVLINQDLKDAAGYTVELYPDKDQAKKFEVISDDIEADELITEFENLSRSNFESITMITRDPVSRADIEWFKRY